MINLFKNLSQDIQDVVFSDLDIVLNDELCQKYGLSDDKSPRLSGLVGDLLLKKISLSDLTGAIRDVFSFNDNLAGEMAIDIIGKRLLIFDDYFGGQAERYLRSLGGRPDDYIGDITRQKEAIKQARLEREQGLEEENEPLLSVEAGGFVESSDEEEKKAAPEIFKTSIVDFLNIRMEETKEILDDYNGVLIILMDKDKNFQRDLEEALYENQEKLTSQKITLGGKPEAPTIANWLKCFVAERGSGYFDNLALSDFVVNSANSRPLSAPEKKMVGQLLTLYRNLKFFPQSLANVPPEEWEIIPVEREEQEINKSINQENKKPTNQEFRSAPDLQNMSPLEQRAFMEENNLSPEDLGEMMK